jgi:predicted glycosyltransferase
MDEPGLLAPEWERKHAAPAVKRYYDDIWVYGLPQICDPLKGIGLPASTRKRMTYTGYLNRTLPQAASHPHLEKISGPYLLVTVGGGGDGEEIVDWVLRAYEADPDLPHPALIVLGPFMSAENVEAITFDSHLETLMDRALGVISMGGYNTFCEILSFDKRAIVVPRTRPRMEERCRSSRCPPRSWCPAFSMAGPT